MRTTVLRSFSRNAVLVLAPLALSVGLSPGCAAKKPTEIVAGVTTQIQVPKEIKAVGFIIQAAGEGPICRVYPAVREDGDETATVRLPSTLGMVPTVGKPKRNVTTTILGFRRALDQNEMDQSSSCLGLNAKLAVKTEAGAEGEALLLRKARSQYIDDKILYLPMPLKPSCKNIGCPNEEETCKAGKCVTIEVDATRLKDYTPDLVFGASNTCFRVNDQPTEGGSLPGCFTKQLVLPARVVNKDTCVYSIPLPEPYPAPPVPQPKGVNVRLTYNDFGTEVLDVDPADAAENDQEGFTVPDPSKPYQFKLAPNLCALTKDDPARPGFNLPVSPTNPRTPKIVQVQAAWTCPSKTQFQPMCTYDVKAAQKNGGDGLTESSPLCFKPGVLQPAKSGLYITTDRSKGMKPFFGPKGVKQLLDLSLQDPALQTAIVGFKFLPADVASCTAAQNPWGNLSEAAGDIPFTNPETARTQIANLIGDESKVLPNDPNVLWDVAMRPNGAYGALANLPGDVKYNRRAVLLIGNRDFDAHCAGGRTLAQLAGDALTNQKIHTYVVVLGRLDDKGTEDPSDDARAEQSADVTNANAIALAGGTLNAFDATSKPEEGARALNTVVNDLSSCLYEATPELSTASASNLLPKYALSYLSFTFDGTSVTNERADVPHNAACAEGSPSDVSGFNLDADGRIRICGAACTRLRDTLSQTAAYGAAAVPPQPSAGVPIRVTRACE